MRRFRFLTPILVLVILGLSVSACMPAQSGSVGSQAMPPLFVPASAGQAEALAPVQAPTAAPLPVATTLPPTVAPTATTAPTAAPTATSAPATSTVAPTVAPPTATTAPTEAPAAAAAAQAGPKTFVITEADLQNAIGSGTLAANGVDVKNLAIHITGGKLHLTADSLNYGLVRLNNLDIVGTLYAQDGALQIQVESIAPGGFATAMLPGMANQALKQYSAQAYIEQVTTKEGEIDLVVR